MLGYPRRKQTRYYASQNHQLPLKASDRRGKPRGILLRNKIASYDETDRARLLSDTGIIRNRLKVYAAIENARRIQTLRNEYGSFKGWLDSHHPQTLENWTKLFKRTFIFTGGEIVKEFLAT